MRFVLGAGGNYRARLVTLIDFFVKARVLREEPILGIRESDILVTVALVSFSNQVSPPALGALREQPWADLGDTARSRYEAFGEAVPSFSVNADHLHLNMLGVRLRAQGRGLGGALLGAVHQLSAHHATSRGVSLTTEQGSNVPLYEHLGYEVRGTAKIEDAFTTWSVYRADPTDTQPCR